MFEKTNAARDVLYSLARYCTIKPERLRQLFDQESLYPQRIKWAYFLERFLLALSAILLASGVIFFFAYNWADMHKFVKLGLLQGVVLLLIGLVLFAGFERRVKEMLLTLSAVMLGVLFAVYGQIYQTGANAYDFFQGWAMGVLLWALAGRSSYLWLLFLVLVNLTLHFYGEQVARFAWPSYLLPMLLFLINATAVAIWEFLQAKKYVSVSSRWFPTSVGLAAIIINTAAVGESIFDRFREGGELLLLSTLALYGLGIWWGLRQRRMFYPAAIGLSLIVMGTCFLARLFDTAGGEAALLLTSLFVIGATTALVFFLKRLSKLWYGNN